MIGAALWRAFLGNRLPLIRQPLTGLGGWLVLLLIARAALLMAVAGAADGLSHDAAFREKAAAGNSRRRFRDYCQSRSIL